MSNVPLASRLLDPAALGGIIAYRLMNVFGPDGNIVGLTNFRIAKPGVVLSNSTVAPGGIADPAVAAVMFSRDG
jgi:hypothetical protein